MISNNYVYRYFMVSSCFGDFLVYVFFNGFVTLRIILLLFAQLLFYDFDMICLHYFYDSFTKANAKLEMAGEGGGGGGGGQWAGLWVADGWRDRDLGGEKRREGWVQGGAGGGEGEGVVAERCGGGSKFGFYTKTLGNL